MASFEHAPIHRHDAIAPFSRDHYVGLVQARHLIKSAGGDAVDRRRVVAQFIDAWDGDIVEHFRDEERLLLPLMNEADQEHMRAQHKQIAELADRVRAERKKVDPVDSLLRELGELLESHIRWEERELFNRLQDDLSAGELDELQRSTASIEDARPRNVCRTPGTTGDEPMPTQIDPQTTVGALVTERPARSRVFETLAIDYCCGGKKPLSEACAKRGLDPQAVIELIQEADDEGGRSEDMIDADALSLTDLADHIEREHHAYLRSELPRLDAMTEKVYRVHGEAEPRLGEVRRAFCALRDELTSHMMKEEQILFPLVRQLEQSDDPVSLHCGTIADPIRQMEAEHEHAGDALATIRTATDNFQPPDWACNTYRAMLDGLAQFERDMHVHIHKENNVLFPKALALEAGEQASAESV